MRARYKLQFARPTAGRFARAIEGAHAILASAVTQLNRNATRAPLAAPNRRHARRGFGAARLDVVAEESTTMDHCVLRRGVRARHAIVDRYNVLGPGERFGFDADAGRAGGQASESGIAALPLAPARGDTSVYEWKKAEMFVRIDPCGRRGSGFRKCKDDGKETT